MKRIGWLVLLLGCFCFALGGVAVAEPGEVGHWEWDEDLEEWDGYSGGGAVQNVMARCFTSLPDFGGCNAKYWSRSVEIHASVAQWVAWTISAKRWDWFVMKPGKYAADCITYTIASNQDVKFTFADFGDLYTQETKYVTPNIPTYYATGYYTPDPPDPTSGDWIRAESLNGSYDFFDSAELHAGLSGKLWILIDVVPSNSACEYHDDATISLELMCQKDWVTDAGDWDWDYLPSPT